MAKELDNLTFAFRIDGDQDTYLCVRCAMQAIKDGYAMHHIILEKEAFPLLCNKCGKIIAECYY